MKPTKLIMCGFGSYGGKNEIDFALLGENGLYLITGDTGAGKTTVFDAISFALYGEPSGENRETKMLRSKYAGDNPTYVEMWFTYGVNQYYIKRNPEYMRAKTRGEGYTIQKADAQFKRADGELITGSKEVTRAVTELMGIDKSRFSKIAMLAQGEFLKLLSASTDEKTEIFRRLFNTQKYDDLRLRLKKEAADRKSVLDELCKESAYAIASARCGGLEDIIRIGNAVDKNAVREAEETILEAVKVLGEEGLQIQSELEKLMIEKDSLSRRSAIAKEGKRIKADIDKNKKLAAEAETETIRLKALADLADSEENRSKTRILTEKIAVIENSLEKYLSLEELTKKKEQSAKKVAEFAKAATDREEEISLLSEQRKIYAETAENLKHSGEEKLELQGKDESISREIKIAEEITVLCKEYYKLSDIADKRKAEYLAAREKTSALSQRYLTLSNAFSDAQAGIMASVLREGEPCPVCGSAEHPNLAKMPENSPTEHEVKAARQKLEESRNAQDRAAVISGEAASALAAKEQEILKKAESPQDTIEQIKTKSEENLQNLQKEQLIIQEKLLSANEKIEKRRQAEEQLPKIDSKINLLTEKKLNAEKEKIRSEQEEKSLLDEEKRMRAELEFKDIDEAKGEAENMRTQKQAIDDKISRTKNALDEHKTMAASLNSAVDALEKQLEAISEKSLPEEIEKELKAVNEKMAELNLKRDENLNLMNINSAAAAKLKGMDEKIDSAAKSYSDVKIMADTASGDIAGKEKIRLEAYVQRTYFERIIERANVRLMIMTKGKYELKRSLEAENLTGKSGLDLSVVDHYNGSERSTKSLSGGESFMASLSLALGLSDEIQSSAGGIRLESMFVDEGFGSLDNETLQGAIKVLSKLTDGNRIIGIISHVDRLKDKIENKIVVKKDKTGNSSAVIYHG